MELNAALGKKMSLCLKKSFTQAYNSTKNKLVSPGQTKNELAQSLEHARLITSPFSITSQTLP